MRITTVLGSLLSGLGVSLMLGVVGVLVLLKLIFSLPMILLRKLLRF